MLDFAHISYSGVGGLAEVALSLLGPARREPGRHHVLFYGCEPLAASYALRCARLGCGFDYIGKREGFDLQSLAALRDWLFHRKPDVIISHMPQTIFASIPYLLRHPGAVLLSVEHLSNTLKTSREWTLSVLNHWASGKTILLTERSRDEMCRRLPALIRDRRIQLIPNGVDTERFSPAPPPITADPPTIGMQARMVDGKDYSTLLRSFAALRRTMPGTPLRLVLAGDGPDRPRIEAEIGELQLTDAVELPGLLPQEELIDRMRRWTVFALITEGETMSRAIMEAQAIGLPIVATRVGGVTAAIRHEETGWLVPFGDADALTAALNHLLTHGELRSRLGASARAHAVATFSIENAWRSYRDAALARVA